ncbi:MAG: hypothetical protein FWD28_10950, partial [Treponema sp.]|nr:hypothetical protein [Treponema sp.]
REREKWQVVVTEKDALLAVKDAEIANGKNAVSDNKKAIARNMLSEGLTPELIHKITGLDLETIKGLSSAS